jgi:hypothetical protein
MTILQKPQQSRDGRAGKRWYKFGHVDDAVRHTDAWEHETFAEEQARWERSDPDYARICEAVRQEKKRGGEASRLAEEAKAEWDASVATQRQSNDAAQRAHHASRDGQMPTGELTDSFVPATEEPSRKERSDATLGLPRA